MRIALAVIMGLSVARSAFWGGALQENLAMIRRYRARHFLASLPVLAVTTAVMVALLYASPVMRVNPFLWVIAQTFHVGSGQGQGNVYLSAVLGFRWYAIAYLPVLALALPGLVAWEEGVFRAGTRNWAGAVVRSLLFGLTHLIALVPLGTALALAIPGLWLTWQYWEGGTERSALYHAASDTIVTAVALVLVLSA